MSKAVTLTAFLITGLVFFACERIETKKSKYPSGKLKARWEVTISKEGEFKNGVSEEFYENGKIKSVVNYLDNKEHGLYRSYFENGKTQAEIYFVEGLMHGNYKEWYDNGNKKRFANYMDGMLDGEIEIWDAKGSLVSSATYENNTCKEGDCGKVSRSPGVKAN